MTLTKADIVARVYAEGMLTKAEADSAVERSLELIKDALATEEEVLISGFGKWSVRRKAQRRGRNPQTGNPLILDARKVVTFRPSRVLKSKIQMDPVSPASPVAKEQGSQAEGEEQPVIRPGYF